MKLQRVILRDKILNLTIGPGIFCHFEIRSIRDVQPSLWPREIIYKYAVEIDKRIFAKRSVWTAAQRGKLFLERVATAQVLFADLGWTYENHFGRNQIRRWVQRAFTNQGRGEPNRYGTEPVRYSSDLLLAELTNEQLLMTWGELQAQSTNDLINDEGPADDTPTLADWAWKVQAEILYRRAVGVLPTEDGGSPPAK